MKNIFKINPKKIVSAIDKILQKNRELLENILKQKSFTWKKLMYPLENMDYQLNSKWSIVSHLNAVMDFPSLREAYQQCLPKISEYASEISQNEKLFQAIRSLTEKTSNNNLNSVQQKIIQDELTAFRLAGVGLSNAKKEQLAKLHSRLSKLMNKFEENLLDATQAWNVIVDDEKELKGIPEYAIQRAAELAAQKNVTGWIFTLDATSYTAIMSFAESRNLRQKLYYAYTTRASDVGPTAGKFDNSNVMQDILKTRLKIAKLLGYKNYAELSVIKKTAKNTREVLDFLNNLIEYTLPIAKKEFEELTIFAEQNFQIHAIQAWDINYISEKYRQYKLAFSEEDLRPYFFEDNVLKGMFEITGQLFGIKFKENFSFPAWHKDVRVFEIYDQTGQFLGHFYADLYARDNKRSGAWMDAFRPRRRLANGKIQTPIAFLTCNFTPPLKNKPALFSHDEVQTLFHEFGHTLNEILSKIDYPEAAGTAHIPWDVVEFPSQFLENWCWEKSALLLFAKHFETEKPLPEALFKKLKDSKTFLSALAAMRQFEFALFDFRLHIEFDPNKKNQVQTILKNVRKKTLLYSVPDYNRFANSFAHIFGSSYAAGYYSYKWAEVWSCDAFSEFEERGIFNPEIGAKFLCSILEKGSSEEPLDMFVAFRGRSPKIDALLNQMLPSPEI